MTPKLPQNDNCRGPKKSYENMNRFSPGGVKRFRILIKILSLFKEMKNVTNDLNAPPQHGSCPCGFCEKQKKNRVLKRAYANEPPGINSHPCGFSEKQKKKRCCYEALLCQRTFATKFVSSWILSFLFFKKSKKNVLQKSTRV